MKNQDCSLPNQQRRAALVWLLCILFFIAALVWLLPRSQINSSVLALLPKEEVTGVPSELPDGFNKRLDKQLVWLVSPPDGQDTAPAAWWLQQLQAMPELNEISGPIDEHRQHAWAQFLYQYRSALIDPATRQRLSQGADVQTQWILSQLYSPFAGVSAKELNSDPLLLIRSAQMSQQQNAAALRLEKNWLVTTDPQGKTWYLLHGELKASSYNITSARATVAKLQTLKQQLQEQWPGAEVLQRGTLFYSDYASQQAQQDISTIGVISGLGIILLMLFVFRSLKPLALTLLSLGVGVLFGTVATLLVFGEVHIMTLVMSTSVVGISIDYALHYLTERMVHGGQESPFESRKKLLPALSLAVISSSAAYLILLLAPFPGLQQLAVFAACGLTGAFLTVVCFYPLLVNRLPVRPLIIWLTWLQRWLNLWQRRSAIRWVLPLCLIVIGIVGISRLTTDDDIAKLQTMPPELQRQERQIAQLTGQHSDQKWFIVYADRPELALQRLEALKPHLDEMKARGALGDYKLLPLPSQQTQQQNIALLQQQTPNVVERLKQAGLPIVAPEISDRLLSAEQWQNSVVSDGWRLLWLSLPDGQSAALVPVNDVTDAAALSRLGETLPGVHWVDKRAEFSDLFSVYRHYLSWLLIAATVMIGALFLIKFGLQRGIYCTIPTIVSLLVGLGLLGLTGQTLNLFSLLALILVLGIGIDYTLFFSNPKGTPATSMLSIIMAALTTQLTFGLLALSGTQAISGFGLVLIGGILTAFLLSPLALPKEKEAPDET
jgi:predicted exporter